MRQLYFIKKGKLQWREVARPEISDKGQAIVTPIAVAKCDLDDAFLFNNLSAKIKIGTALGKIDPKYNSIFGDIFKGPFPFGHECVARVTEIGEDVKNIKIGDVVSVPFQISCGSCLNCSNGFTSVCEKTPALSMFGFGKHLQFGGAMSDFLKIPFADAMLLKIPDHVDPVHLASLSDNIPDAYRHLKGIEANPDQKVLIVAGHAKSVGIYALMIAKAMGVSEVDYVDHNRERLDIAQKLHANNIFENFHQLTGKYDLVIDASSTKKGLEVSLKSVRHFGTISSSGLYIRKTPLSLVEMYAKGVNFKIGLANSRTDSENVLKLLSKTTIPFELATTKLENWANAEDAFLTETTKVIVKRESIA
jgi:threonine dehydrogenase-like Zn-dependent dehydrogenase